MLLYNTERTAFMVECWWNILWWQCVAANVYKAAECHGQRGILDTCVRQARLPEPAFYCARSIPQVPVCAEDKTNCSPACVPHPSGRWVCCLLSSVVQQCNSSVFSQTPS